MKNIIVNMLMLAVLLVVVNTTTGNATSSSNKYDYDYLLKNIDNNVIFKDIQINSYTYYNTGKYRDKYLQKDILFLNNAVKCMDKIYEVNKKTYDFSDKLRYYYFRNVLTYLYSIEETTSNYKKYLYITYKFREIEITRPDLEFPYDVDLSGYYEEELMKKYNVKSEQELKRQITEDKQLQNDPELNQNLF